MNRPTALYEAVVMELRKQIFALGLTMQQCDDLSGNENGYTAKMMAPGTPSGRQARWETMQNLVDAIFAGGFKIRIKPAIPVAETRAKLAPILERQGHMLPLLSTVERMAQKPALAGKIAIRDWAPVAGKKGALARAQKLSPRQRQKIARRAARARWLKARKQAMASL